MMGSRYMMEGALKFYLGAPPLYDYLGVGAFKLT